MVNLYIRLWGRSTRGSKYESGEGLGAADPERARYYFRLCAARGVARCELNLGRLLIPPPGEKKGDPVQALAWLELASDVSPTEAAPLTQSLRQQLSADDIEKAEKLKLQLLRK